MTGTHNGQVQDQATEDETDLAAEYVSVKDLARWLRMDRSHARRYVIRMGYRPFKIRTADSGGQRTLVVTRSEANEILGSRQHKGFPTEGGTVRTASEAGFFYIIQLVPELCHGRIKLGFAADVQVRLQEHRTAAPTARLVRNWPCRRTWEVTAIDSITREGCQLILNEVYHCDDLESLVQRVNDFFDRMPATDFRPDLSTFSPLIRPDGE